MRTNSAPAGNAQALSDLKWLDTNDAAEYLRTTVGGIRNLIYRGQIAAYKPFGKKLMFKRSDLDRIIESSRKGGFYVD